MLRTLWDSLLPESPRRAGALPPSSLTFTLPPSLPLLSSPLNYNLPPIILPQLLSPSFPLLPLPVLSPRLQPSPFILTPPHLPLRSGKFSTRSYDTRIFLSDMIDHVVHPLPCKAVFYINADTSGEVEHLSNLSSTVLSLKVWQSMEVCPVDANPEPPTFNSLNRSFIIMFQLSF